MQNKLSSDSLSLCERVRQAARQLESEIIIEALEQHRWNRRFAAESLMISYQSLMYKMKSCNLPNDPPAAHVDNIAR
jgi:transcriptional regulator with PAS, ATPase and Fis domain